MTAVTLFDEEELEVILLPRNCTGRRQKGEVYAANFFTNESFLQTLDNGVPFHDALALEVL